MNFDRKAYATAFLAKRRSPLQRRVMAACLAVADDEGFVDLDLALISPLSGNRFRYAGIGLEELILDGWLTLLGDGKAKLIDKTLDKDPDGSFPGDL